MNQESARVLVLFLIIGALSQTRAEHEVDRDSGMPHLSEVERAHIQLDPDKGLTSTRIFEEYSSVVCNNLINHPTSSNAQEEEDATKNTRYCEFRNICIGSIETPLLFPSNDLSVRMYIRRLGDRVQMPSITTPFAGERRINSVEQIIGKAPIPSDGVLWINDSYSVLLSSSAVASAEKSLWDTVVGMYWSLFKLLKASNVRIPALREVHSKALMIENYSFYSLYDTGADSKLLFKGFVDDITPIESIIGSHVAICFKRLISGVNMDYRHMIEAAKDFPRERSMAGESSWNEYVDISRREWFLYLNTLLRSMNLLPLNLRTCLKYVMGGRGESSSKEKPLVTVLLRNTTRVVIRNQHELIERAKSYNNAVIQILHLEDTPELTVADQVRMIRKSVILVGVEGADLFHSIFMCPGTNVIVYRHSQPHLLFNEAIYLTGINFRYLSPLHTADDYSTSPEEGRDIDIDIDQLFNTLDSLVYLTRHAAPS